MGINELKSLLVDDGSNKAIRSRLRELEGLRKNFIRGIKDRLNCVVRGVQYIVNSDYIQHYSKNGTIRLTLTSAVIDGHATYSEVEEYVNGLLGRLSDLDVGGIEFYQVSICCGKVVNRKRLGEIKDFVDTGNRDDNWIVMYVTIKDPYY